MPSNSFAAEASCIHGLNDKKPITISHVCDHRLRVAPKVSRIVCKKLAILGTGYGKEVGLGGPLTATPSHAFRAQPFGKF